MPNEPLEPPNEALNEPAVQQTAIFGAASLFNDASSDMIAPIWPLFLQSYLGLTYLMIGFIDGLALAVTSLSMVAAGYFSDRWGKRKPFITAGYFLSMVSRIGFALSTGFGSISFAKAMDRVGKIRGPPRDAMVAGENKETKRGRAFGILRAMDSTGAVAGASITFVLFWVFGVGYIPIILLAAIPAALAVIVVAAFIKERRGKNVFKGVSFSGFNRNLKIFFVASTLFALATFSYSFLVLFARDYYPDYQVLLLYIAFVLTDAVSTYPFGRASDRFGRKPILILGFTFLALTSTWAHLATSWLTVIPLFVLFGLSAGALTPVQVTLVADLVEPERAASVLGAFQMVIGVAALPADVIIGYLWQTFSPLVAFDFSMIFAFAAILLMLLIKVGKPSDE
jgi:MFS family permease